MAANGVPVLVYDYRGIGASRPPTLRGFRAVHEDWSELDCGGAIQYLRALYPRAELIGMAHSIGTLLVGGAPNVAEISRFVFICAHTGYYGDYMPRYRMPMAALWHGVMPLLTGAFGYFPAKILGLGEDIPGGIARQWAARRTPEFRPEATEPDAARARTMISRYQHVTGPVLAVGFTDDVFATRAGTHRLLEAFPRLCAQLIVIAPQQVGMAKIGHFGFLRGAAEEALWPIFLTFLRDGRSP
jgi:predicted alpha/beta hydrolase